MQSEGEIRKKPKKEGPGKRLEERWRLIATTIDRESTVFVKWQERCQKGSKRGAGREHDVGKSNDHIGQGNKKRCLEEIEVRNKVKSRGEDWGGLTV